MSKRPKAEVPTATRLLIPARETRMTMENHGGFNPMVMYAPRHGQPMMAILEEDGVLEVMVEKLLIDMRRRLGPAEWIAVTSDCYVQHTAEPVAHERGSLARAFKEGDLNVSEQMVVLLKRRNQPAEMAVQSYRHIPSEGWEWDEPELVLDQQGGVIDVINHYT